MKTQVQLLMLIVVLLQFHNYNCFAIDYEKYKKDYPEAAEITLEHKVSITYFWDETAGKTKAKSTHKVTRLALEDNLEQLKIISIPFSTFEKLKIKSTKVYYIDSDNNKILKERVKTKYLKTQDYYINGIFYSDLKVKQIAPTVELPARTLITYDYDVIYDDLKFLNKFNVHNGYSDVEKFEFNVHIPKGVEAAIQLFNIKSSTLKKVESSSETGNTTSYTLSNISLKKYENTTLPFSYYAPHFVIITKSCKSGGKSATVLASTDDLYRWYASLINELEPNKEKIKTLATSIVPASASVEDKITKIYQWVQLNINYVAFEDGIAGFKPTEAHDVIDARYGDCKGMANLTVALLQAHGIQAYHTWIGTRSLPYDYSLPSLIVDNHMICTVDLEGKTYFLDATDKAANWQVPPAHIQGKEAMIGLGTSYKIVKVPVNSAENNEIKLLATINVKPAASIAIEGDVEITGLERDTYLLWYKYQPIWNQAKSVGTLTTYLIKNFALANNQTDPITWTEKKGAYKFVGQLDGVHQKSGQLIYLFPNIVQEPFTLLNQLDKNLVYFDHQKKVSYQLTYKLPAGAIVANLPIKKEVASPDNLLKFEVAYQINGNDLQVTGNLWINTLSMNEQEKEQSAAFFEELNRILSTPLTIALP